MTEEDEVAELIAEITASNPLAAELVRITQEGMREFVHELTKDGSTVEINGVKFGPDDVRVTPK